MIANDCELITYSTAEELAGTFHAQIKRVRESLETLADATDILQDQFQDSYSFRPDVTLRHQNHYIDSSDGIDKLIAKMELAAWKAIVEKINIKRLMSSSAVDKMNRVLNGEVKSEFPPITPENIERVVAGFAMSANEFLEESIEEEYRWWRPSKHHADYKRNSDWKLNRKIIRPWMIESCYRGGFRVNYSNQQHATALDNIFHLLDGQGPVKDYKGALVSSIEASGEASGKTNYFAWKCYRNGNLHLEFLRTDLLDLFNTIAAKRDRIGTGR